MEKRSEKIERIIDANLNRAREGLRVVEDMARFVLYDKELTESAKNMRSEISAIQKKHGYFLNFRDTEGDVGTVLNSAIESKRESLTDITEANIKRVEESLRVLEEMFKLIDSESSLKFKRMRYKCYILEKETLNKLGNKL